MNVFKKFLACLLVLSLLAGLCMASAANEPDDGAANCPFVDIPDEATADAVTRLFEMGIVKGKSSSRFGPEDVLNRAEFVTLFAVQARKSTKMPRATLPT